jgi:hypothetical protein
MEEEEEEVEEEMDLETLRKISRFSAMSIEGRSSDDAESYSPPRMSPRMSLQAQPLEPPVEPSVLQSQLESQVLELNVQELESVVSERSRPRGLGIHSGGRKITKSRSRSRSPTKSVLKY